MGDFMINYSVFLLHNQMNKDEAPKAYARAQAKEVMTFRKFVDHIAEHGGHKRGQVKGVLSDMCNCLVEQLLEGKKILLDELGDFWISLTCIGSESIETFTSKNITGVNIVFTPGVDFQNLINKAEFNLVASRIAQSATLKAEKKMLDTVDLAAAKSKGNGSSADPSDPSDPTDPSDPSDPGTNPGIGDDGDEELPPVIGGDENGGGGDDEVIDNGDLG